MSQQNRSYPNETPQNGGQVFSVSEKTDAVFQAAFRHSKKVQQIKIALPIIALIVSAIFIWFTFFNVQSAPETMILNNDWSDDGTITMTQPTLEGYSKTNQYYSMKAERAIQLPNENGMIQLKEIIAQIPMATRGHATINAENGFYDNVNGRLKFDKPFSVTTSDGMVANFLSADIAIESSQVNSNDPVDIKRGPQHLTADSMQVKDNGSVIVFNGNIHLVIDNELEQ